MGFSKAQFFQWCDTCPYDYWYNYTYMVRCLCINSLMHCIASTIQCTQELLQRTWSSEFSFNKGSSVITKIFPKRNVFFLLMTHPQATTALPQNETVIHTIQLYHGGTFSQFFYWQKLQKADSLLGRYPEITRNHEL